ncbi:hypothetical protein [Polyangium sp. 6x1]|uniref:hypothetical protein n=1 Tax=Polyangium sp. 6x1 TaxID=3042689 RepID=UPI0024829B56|nr:hypothetical protein [Polyangium sp. 6x1]MDI1448636.1 hypothetical protein [Polyangium sp. 6x1]
MSFLRLLGIVGLSAFFVGCGEEVAAETAPGAPFWARRFGRDNYAAPVGLAGVASGGVIVAGRHYGDIDLGGGPLPSPSNNHQAYVARYDGEGNHVYSRSLGAEFSEEANDVAALPDGSALVAGTFRWSLNLDGISLPWGGGDDAFVAKLDPAGKVVWARTFGGAGNQRGRTIAAMPDGGAVVTGSTWGEVDLGIGEPQAGSNGDFLVRLAPDGTPMWSRTFRSDYGYVFTYDLAVRDGVIAVVGEFNKALEVGLDFDLVAFGQHDGFLVTYDFEGKPSWSRNVGGAGYSDTTTGAAFTDDGGLVLTGSVEGNVDLGGGLLSVSDEYDTNTYLLELDAKGNHRRSALYGGNDFDTGQGITMASDGSVILTGDMRGHMSFGEVALASHEDELWGDAFVAQLDAYRNPVFVRRIGGTDFQSGQQAVVDGQGRVYVAGTAMGVVDFGLGPTPSTGYYETFVVALAP